jgi:DNA-binding HxlR family transcriptional regulator
MELPTACPVAFTSRIMGGKWKARIVWALVRNETLRFSELRRACPPVSDRILSKELKELEAWGLISRREHPTIPPRTDYRLTELGETLRPVMAAMADWGLAHRSSIDRTAGDQGSSLELKAPNAETRAALDEAADILRERGARFDSA